MMSDTDSHYVTSAAVRKRFGDVSDMWIERRLKDESGFPKPIYIGRRRYWKIADLIDWERSKAASSGRAAR